MSLKIGGSKSNSSSTSNTTTSSTATPIVPEWASNLTQNVAGRVGGLLANDPQSLVAPANGLQNLAGTNATNLSGTPWDYDAAEELTGAVANSDTPNIASYLGRFMNPFLNSVVGATSADLDANEGKVHAQQALDLAGSGAFGGSGAALTQSATEGELARARATTLGNLRSQGFAQALGGATSQAQLQQQQQAQRLAAAGQLAGIAGEFGANQRANVATQLAAGDDLRNVAQQQAQAPVTSTQQLVALLSGLPINLFAGQQTDGTSNTATKGQSTNVHADAGISYIGNPNFGGG